MSEVIIDGWSLEDFDWQFSPMASKADGLLSWYDGHVVLEYDHEARAAIWLAPEVLSRFIEAGRAYDAARGKK